MSVAANVAEVNAPLGANSHGRVAGTGGAAGNGFHREGESVEAAHPMYTLVECGGLHGHIKVSKSGIVYVPNKSCGSNQGLIVSMDDVIFELLHGSEVFSADRAARHHPLYFSCVKVDRLCLRISVWSS
jgi:hypothetical protein